MDINKPTWNTTVGGEESLICKMFFFFFFSFLLHHFIHGDRNPKRSISSMNIIEIIEIMEC